MELVLVVLTAPTPAAGTGISPQILADILWANAQPADGLQHVNIRTGPEPGSHIVGLFFLAGDPLSNTGTTADAASRTALELCHRATTTSPPLSQWSVALHVKPAPSSSWSLS